MRCKRASQSLVTDAAAMPTVRVCVRLPSSPFASVPLSSKLFGSAARAVTRLRSVGLSAVLRHHVSRFVSGRPAPLECSQCAGLRRPCSALRP